MVFSSKDSPAQKMVERRVGVAARYKYAFTRYVLIVIPQDGNPMGSILAAEANNLWEHFGAAVF